MILIMCENCRHNADIEIRFVKRFDDFNFHWVCPRCSKVNNTLIKGRG